MKKLFLVFLMLAALVLPSAFASDAWVGVSVDAATPYTGMAILYNGIMSGTKDIFFDGILNAEIGATPFKISDEVSVGIILRGSVAFGYADDGTYNVYGPFYLGTDNFYYTETWFAISPMVAISIQTGSKSHINIGAGISCWEYTTLTYNIQGYNNYSFDRTSWLSSANGTHGISLAALLEIGLNNANIEFGIIGPDVFFGIGFST